MVKKILLDYKGLIPAIVQHEETKEVLMLGYMNQESLDKTLETGDVWFYSRSRDQLWHKGETSGNYLKLGSISSDCDVMLYWLRHCRQDLLVIRECQAALIMVM